MMHVRQVLRRFVRCESGSMTIHGLFTFAACCAIGAIGLDVTHIYAARTQLQVAADLAAHAALYQRYQGRSPTDARSDAIAAVQYGMPRTSYGDVITPTDIRFGNYAAATRTFTPTATSSTALPAAVEVRTSQAGDNPVATFLFRIVGVNEMDVSARALFVATGDPCDRTQGLFAIGEVTPNSNNFYSGSFCVHSQTRVGEQNEPNYAPGSSVSAPNMASLTCQNKCTSFNNARRTGSYDLNQRLNPLRLSGTLATETRADLLADVRAAMPNWDWNGISQTIEAPALPTGSGIISPSSVNNRVVYYDCRSSGGSAPLDGTYRKTVLLLHGCAASLKDVTLEDSIVYTTNTDPRNSIAVHGSGSLMLGTDNNCDGSGSAAILTRGGFDAPAKLKFEGGTVLALGNVKFAAQFGYAHKGDAGQGVSIVSGGTIDPTSNNNFIACPPPANYKPSLVTFTLAQ
jgi:hypothetical protein